MKIINQYVVERYKKFQILFESEDGYFITHTGQFNQQKMSIEKISKKEAEKLIKNDSSTKSKSGLDR